MHSECGDNEDCWGDGIIIYLKANLFETNISNGESFIY
jgi:hypothetical protein